LNSKTVQDRAIVTTADQNKIIFDLMPYSMTLTTPNPDFKVTPIFDAEYLSNSRRQRHIYNETWTGTPMWSIKWPL